MLGYAHVAGFRDGPRQDAETIARYFAAKGDAFPRLAAGIETAELPEIILVQNQDRQARVSAAAIFPSVWSRSYLAFGTPYGRVHRDFHYQVMFSAMAALVETGCDAIRIDNPMGGMPWRRDAYVCLMEAVGNIRRRMNPGVAVHLQEGTYDPRMPADADAHASGFDLQDHRPVGVHLHIRDGFNMRTVFVEKTPGMPHR